MKALASSHRCWIQPAASDATRIFAVCLLLVAACSNKTQSGSDSLPATSADASPADGTGTSPKVDASHADAGSQGPEVQDDIDLPDDEAQEIGPGVERHNEGPFCLGHAEPGLPSCTPVTFADNTAFSIIVDLSCRPCAEELQVGCSATLQDDLVTLESFVIAPTGFDYCGDDVCDSLFAECQTPPLPDGHYRVVHGDQILELDVPSTTANTCSNPDTTRPCCTDDSQCALFETCDDNHCVPFECDRMTRCPQGSFCKGRYCLPCPCSDGLDCGPRTDDCALAESTGPSYQRCETQQDCTGRLEYCLVEASTCMARCFDDSDCEPFPDAAFETQCINHDGLTDDSSCLVACRDASPRCPENMECYLDRFCAFPR